MHTFDESEVGEVTSEERYTRGILRVQLFAINFEVALGSHEGAELFEEDDLLAREGIPRLA